MGGAKALGIQLMYGLGLWLGLGLGLGLGLVARGRVLGKRL